MAQGSGHFLIGHVCSVLFVQRRKREKKAQRHNEMNLRKGSGGASKIKALWLLLWLCQFGKANCSSAAFQAHSSSPLCFHTGHHQDFSESESPFVRSLGAELRKHIPQQPPSVPFPGNFLQVPTICGSSFTFWPTENFFFFFFSCCSDLSQTVFLVYVILRKRFAV